MDNDCPGSVAITGSPVVPSLTLPVLEGVNAISPLREIVESPVTEIIELFIKEISSNTRFRHDDGSVPLNLNDPIKASNQKSP